VTAIPKPEPRKRVKGRRRRAERKVIDRVRPAVVARDGYCRVANVRAMGACRGASEWAHLGEKRRFRTRGLPPDERHTTADSVMFCDGHHDAYDDHAFEIEKLTTGGADGRLRYVARDGTVLHEEP